MKLYFKNEFNYKTRTPKLCAYGTYKGYDFLIIYIGMHPCAYIQTDENLYDGDDAVVDCPAHGGFTFYGTLFHWCERFKNVINPTILDQCYLGWDYGHCSDYSFFDYKDSALCSTQNMKHQWTTDEIIENIKQVIDWLMLRRS